MRPTQPTAQRGLPRALAFAALLAAASPTAAAQREAATTPKARVGVFLWHESPNDDATLAGVRRGLEDAGVTAELIVRRADSDAERAARMLGQLDGLDCRLVLALGTRSTQLAQQHLRATPIVFAAVTNPVTAGIVPDWNAKVPNLAGASNWIGPRSVLEVFRLAVPELRSLGMLRSTASGTVSAAERRDMLAHLASEDAPDVTLHEVTVERAEDLADAARQLRRRGVDAIWIPIDLTVYQHVHEIREALRDAPLPLLTTAMTGVQNGALVGAAVDYDLHGRRAATLIQTALQRGRVTGQPVDRMQSSLVYVNLRAARESDIELPLSLLAVADELIAPEAR